MLDLDQAALNTRFFDGFPSDVPVLVTNQPQEQVDETQLWCRWSIQPGTMEPTTTGTIPVYTQLGYAYLQIFAPAGTGTGAAYDLRAKFENLFRSWRSPDGKLVVTGIDNSIQEKPEYTMLKCSVAWYSRRNPPLEPLFDFTNGALPQGALFTRASTANYYDGSGTLRTATADAPRFSYDPLTLTLRGLLIESAATNLLLQSQSLDLSPWGAGGGGNNPAIIANTAIAPDGSATADAIVAGTTNGNQHRTQNVTLPSAGTYTMSGYFKAHDYTNCSLGTVASGTYPVAYFNTSSGQFTSVGAAITATTARQLPNSWWRLSITYTVNTANLVGQHSAAFTNGGAITFLGDGVKNGYFWQGQVEAGSVPTSSIPTTTTSATRAADTLKLNWLIRGVTDGTKTLRYTFDDGSTQDVSTVISGGLSTVPTNLNRTHITRVEPV